MDDITELVSAQKCKLGQIQDTLPYEIKNPLTPQNFHQRIEHSITQKSNYNKSITFKECVDTIIRQVTNIIVSEFSNFARMPQSKIEKAI